MIHSRAALLAVIGLCGTSAMVAQNRSSGTDVTRTFNLNGISSKDAAQLIGPYALAGEGVVFEAGTIRAVTVRGPASLIWMADSLLRVYDRPVTTITLRFMLLAASNRPGNVAGLEGAEQELAALLGTAGYRLVSEATARVGERNSFSIAMKLTEGRMLLSGTIGPISRTEQPTAAMTISARNLPSRFQSDTVAVQMAALGEMLGSHQFIETGLTIPMGHTVVLGSGEIGAGESSLILVVRPEI